MTRSLSPGEIQELAAGYVLGDLDSAEAESFRALLAEVPELQVEVTTLQEALAMMPYGLDEIEPEGELRSQILIAAQAELLQPPLRSPRQTQRSRWAWGMAAGLAIVCGLSAFYWGSQTRRFQLSGLSDAPSVIQTWSGLSQLLQDHQKSLVNPEGPVDFVVQRPDEILSRFKDFRTTIAALPLLPAQKGTLLGGSRCQFGQNQGLRLTYQLPMDTTVSAYQLAVTEEEFPEFKTAQLTLQQPDGTGVVLWREEDYLYALVAELPTAELQSLAYAIEGI